MISLKVAGERHSWYLHCILALVECIDIPIHIIINILRSVRDCGNYNHPASLGELGNLDTSMRVQYRDESFLFVVPVLSSNRTHADLVYRVGIHDAAMRVLALEQSRDTEAEAPLGPGSGFQVQIFGFRSAVGI